MEVERALVDQRCSRCHNLDRVFATVQSAEGCRGELGTWCGALSKDHLRSRTLPGFAAGSASGEIVSWSTRFLRGLRGDSATQPGPAFSGRFGLIAVETLSEQLVDIKIRRFQ
jgi:hypothetical protein